METLEDVQGPRFSFSEDADMVERTALEKRKWEHIAREEREEDEDAEVEEEDDGDTEFSFEFSCSMSLDLPPENKMLSAEELFFNGKLRPISVFGELGEESHHVDKEFLPFDVKNENRSSSSDVKEAGFSGGTATTESLLCKKHSEKAIEGDVRFHPNLPILKTSLHESLDLAKHHLRSLHESPRCLSMTIEGSRGQPRRSCVSLNNSRCSSPSRSRTSGSFSQPRTTPTSPKASSSQKSSKFLHFFKLKKHLNTNKDALFLSSESLAASGSRLSRAFWPFSRSNSAGESKSTRGVSPLPRRSNSAGESKTTSSSLLPNNAVRRNSELRAENTTMSLLTFPRKPQIVQSNHQQAAEKKGMPPLPNPNVKKAGSCFVPTNCGSNSVALSQPGDGTPPTLAPTPISSLSREPTPLPSTVCASTSSPSLSRMSTEVLPASRARSSLQSGEGDHSIHAHADSASMLKEYKAAASPGRHTRHASATNPMRNIARASPARQWSNPNMGGSTRSLQRFGPPPRGHVRAKDVLSRDTASVRVTPVLNVPACMTPSSKSKLFNLGNLFSKKEKVARGYTMLVSTDSQSGG